MSSHGILDLHITQSDNLPIVGNLRVRATGTPC